MILTKIISGCQTGADQAGLAAAKHLGLETGGFCTFNNRTDEGYRPDLISFYALTEINTINYPPRTKANVKASDGTVLFGNTLSPGTKLAIKFCEQYQKPYVINPVSIYLSNWIEDNLIRILNVAGNRERTNPGIYEVTFNTIVNALRKQ